MNYTHELLLIKAACVKAYDDLIELNPDHDLHRFDEAGLSAKERGQKTYMILVEFGSPSYSIVYPTDEGRFLAYQSLHNVLTATVVVEKARRGVFGPT